MSNALELLALPSTQALRVMVQESLKPGVDVSDLVISRPAVEVGNEMSTRISVSGSAYERPDFPYFGAATFTYKRLDLQDSLGFLNLGFEVTFPLITSQVAAKMSEALGIVFEEADYIEELIELESGDSRPYTFKAAPGSPRWMGQVVIQLYRSAG